MIGSVLAVGFALAGLLIFERDLPAEVVDAQYANAQSQFLRTDANDRIHFRDQGPSDAVPIILIHGANGSLHNYEEWARTLSKRYRVISLDLPGHGLTGETATDRYDMDTDLGTIRAVADHLALDRFVLAGHSMGGGVAMAFAQNSPDELLGLVLVSSVIPWRPRSDDPKPIGDAPPLDGNRNTEVNEQEKPKHRNSSTLSLFRLPGVRLIGRHIDPALLAERSARSAYGNEEMVTSALVQRYIDLSLREGSRGALFKRMASRANRLTSPPNFAGPVLIQWGSDDTWTPPSLIQPLIETFPYATVVTYDEVGHLPMEEIPLLSAKDLLSFLDSISLEMNKKAKDDTIGPGSGGCDTIIAGQRLLQE